MNNDIENRFMEQCINHCKGMMDYISNLKDKKKIEPEVADILQLIYILDYAKEVVGKKRVNKFINSTIFSDFNLSYFLKEWFIIDFYDIKEKICFLVKKIEGGGLFNKEYNLSLDKISNKVSVLWDELRFNQKKNHFLQQKLRKDQERKYELIGSKLDLARRKLVKTLVDHPNFDKTNMPKEQIRALCLAYTNACQNNCRHCMASRPIKKSFNFDNSKIDEILSTSSEYGIEILLFTGGEPFLALDKMTYTIENSKASQIFITTSGRFAVDNIKGGKTDKIVSRIWDAFCNNKNEKKLGLGLQISVDVFHQEIKRKEDDALKENSPLINVANLIEIVFKYYPNIKIILMSVRSGHKNSILRYLFDELERRGIEVIDKDETLLLYDQLICSPPTKGPEILQMEIDFKFNDRILRVCCGAQLITRIGKASLLLPWESMNSAYTLEDFMQMKEVDKLALESNMLLIERDGNVYLGGSLAGIWTLGNIENKKLSEIIDYVSFDPLVVAINNDLGQLVKWALEVDPLLGKRISSHPTGMEVLHKTLEDPAMRLYLTKRILLEKDWYSTDIIRDILPNVSLSQLKREYIQQMSCS